jgi:hypothetical protein
MKNVLAWKQHHFCGGFQILQADTALRDPTLSSRRTRHGVHEILREEVVQRMCRLGGK